MGIRKTVGVRLIARSIAAGTLVVLMGSAALVSGSLALVGSGISGAGDGCIWPDPSDGGNATALHGRIGGVLTVSGPSGTPMTLSMRQQEVARPISRSGVPSTRPGKESRFQS